MKIVAAIFADFETNFLGGAAQLAAPLAGRSVLEHALIRLLRVGGIEQRCLFVRARDAERARACVAGLSATGVVDVLPLDDGTRPRRRLIRAARRWNLAGWRGSPLATTWFDEFLEPLAVARVFDHYRCDHVLCIEGHQAALDVGISDGMIAYRRTGNPDAQFIFTQAPPGLAGILLSREITGELLSRNLPLGILLAYRPEMPQADLVGKPHCFRVAPELIHTAQRLNADTRRGRELLAAGWEALGSDCDGKSLCAWLHEQHLDSAGPLPLEVELELTTADPLPHTCVRPRGDRIPARKLEDIEAAARLAAQLAEYDDRAIVLGGHGDPLQHPHFARICQTIKAARVGALGVVTPLVDLSEVNLEALLAAPVDALEVQLDANSAETYAAIHGVDRFQAVLDNLARIDKLRSVQQSPEPIIVPSLVRCAANLHEIEAFYDRWTENFGWALVHGYNDFQGRLVADSLLRLTPPQRAACRRLTRRMLLLADGKTPFCSQDVDGKSDFGNWTRTPLVQLWQCPDLGRLRADHAEGGWGRHATCRSCGEWFRP